MKSEISEVRPRFSRFTSYFSVVTDSLFALAYPQACHLCGESVENSADGIACRACWVKTRVFSGREILCVKCGAYLQESDVQVETFCRRCDDQFYDQARAVGIYENALAASIIHLKSEPFIARSLQKLFVHAFVNSDFQDANLIIPVPLSRKRLLERGFNQAEILARVLARETNIKTDQKSLVRTIHMPIHRAAMDKKARAATVENAFEIKRPALVRDSTVLLIDDVFTSGATVSNCGKILKQNGAKKVYVLTLARTIA